MSRDGGDFDGASGGISRDKALGSGAVMFCSFALVALANILFRRFVGAWFSGAESDAFVFARQQVQIFDKLFLSGAIGTVFLPVFTDYYNNRRGELRAMVANIVNVVFTFGIVLVILMELAAPLIVRYWAPGFTAEQREVAVTCLRIILPSNVLLELIVLAITVLNAEKKFTLPALMKILSPTAAIAVLMAFTPHIGVLAAAWGYLAGTVLQLGAVYALLWRMGYPPALGVKFNHPAVRETAALLGPIALSVFLMQIVMLGWQRIATGGATGTYTPFLNAYLIKDTLAQFLLAIIPTIGIPLISHSIARGAEHEVLTGIRQSLRASVFLIVPAALWTIARRVEIANLLFENRNFTAEDTMLASSALLVLMIGMLPLCFYVTVGRLPILFKDARSQAAVGVLTLLSKLGMIALVSTTGLGMLGLPMVDAANPVIGTILYVFFLRRHVAGIWRIFTDRVYVLVTILSVLLLLGDLTLLGDFRDFYLSSGTLQKIVLLGLSGAVWLFIYLEIMLLFGVGEARAALDFFRRLPKRLPFKKRA